MLYDPINSGLKSHVQYPIGLIEDEELNVVGMEGGGLVHVLEETAGCTDENIYRFETGLLFGKGFSADEEAGGECVVGAYFLQDLEYLHCLASETRTGGEVRVLWWVRL